MSFWEQFPYTNFHDTNLSWVLAEVKKLRTYIENYTAVNKVAYSGIWSITSQYPQWAIVSTDDKTYLSKVAVPSGIEITNDEYWIELADLDPRIAALTAVYSIYENNAVINAPKTFFGATERWLETLHRRFSENIATLISKSRDGNYGGVFASRTSDNNAPVAMSAIGVGGFGIADNTIQPKPTWGGYFEGRRIGNANTAFGVEIDTSSIGTPAKSVSPYDSWENYVGNGAVIGLNLSSGLGYGDNDPNYPYGQSENYGASAAVYIHKNPKRFGKGIVFETESVEDYNAICLPWLDKVTWWRGENVESFINQSTFQMCDYSNDSNPYMTFKRRTADGGNSSGTIGRIVADNGDTELYVDLQVLGNRPRVAFNLGGGLYTFDRDYLIPEQGLMPSLGVEQFPFATAYLNVAPIIVSDARKKHDIGDITDAEKRAVNAIHAKRYKIDGDDRVHFGVVAQDVIEAFSAEGLNALDYGVVVAHLENGVEFYSVCYDELLALKAFVQNNDQ